MSDQPEASPGDDTAARRGKMPPGVGSESPPGGPRSEAGAGASRDARENEPAGASTLPAGGRDEGRSEAESFASGRSEPGEESPAAARATVIVVHVVGSSDAAYDASISGAHDPVSGPPWPGMHEAAGLGGPPGAPRPPPRFWLVHRVSPDGTADGMPAPRGRAAPGFPVQVPAARVQRQLLSAARAALAVGGEFQAYSTGSPDVAYIRHVPNPCDDVVSARDMECVRMACLCACIPPVGLINFWINRAAPKGSQRMLLAKTSLAIAVLVIVGVVVVLTLKLS